MARVLLTGSTGFIGRRVLNRLIQDGHTILAPTRNPARLNDFAGQRSVIPVSGLFYSDKLFAEYQYFAPEIIIHLAALHGNRQGSWNEYYACNVTGTLKLIDFALESSISRFIYCSAVGIYGTVPSRLPADPWTAAIPASLYYRSKHMAEKQVVKQLRNQIPFIIMRPALAYGEGDRETGFLFKLTNLVRKHKLPLSRNDVRIHLMDVNTVADFVGKAIGLSTAEKNGEIIVNLADREPIRLDHLVDQIHNHFYATAYPKRLQISAGLCSLLTRLTRMAQMKHLSTRLEMISNSWYYDTSNVEDIVPISFQQTDHSVQQYLEHTWPDNNQTR